jgi:hypothetical protein
MSRGYFGGISFLILSAVFLFLMMVPQVQAAAGFCNVGGSTFVRVPCPLNGASGPAGSTTFGNITTLILDIALLIVGTLAVLFLIIGAFRYLTAAGNEEATEAAKKMMVQAVVGLVIVILSFAVITIVTNVLVTGVP